MVYEMIAQLRRRLLALQRPPGIGDGPGSLPLGISPIDAVLGGGLMRGALHEIAAWGEAHITAASGFALGIASLCPALGSGQRSARAHALCRPSTASGKQDRDGG